MSKNKKFILILSVMIVIALAIVGFYVYVSITPASAPATTTATAPITNPQLPVTITTTPSATATSSTVSSTGEIIPNLRQVSTTAVAGGVIFDMATTTVGHTGKKVASTITTIRYMEKASGHIFQTSTSTLAVNLISDTDVPGVRQALWSADGSDVYAQYVDTDGATIETYLGQLSALKNAVATSSSDIQFATMQLQGSLLPPNILALTFSPSKSSIFYMTNNQGDAQGITASVGSTQKTQIFSSPITEWTPQWISPTTIALTTKPSGTVPGYLYFMNTGTGILTKVLDSVPGLTTKTSSGAKTIMYSVSQNDTTFGTNLYTVATGVSTAFPVTTLPEKCVWSTLVPTTVYCAVPEEIPSAIYPDAWYQGLVSFSDDIDKIDLATGSVVVLAKPSDLVGQDIDAVDLMLSPTEDDLLFTNKKDGMLWDLNLTAQTQ